MTNQAVPGRPPGHDLSAFDLSRRSPEQVAQSFVRWKAQRKRQEAGPAHAEPLPSPKPAGAETGDAASEDTAPKRASASRASAPRYSAPFSDLLAAGSEPTVQRTVWTPVATLRPPQRTASPGYRLKVMSIVAGAASVLALTGGALLELGDWRDPAEVAPQVAHVRPKEIPMALAAAATSMPAAEWTLRHTVDLALMKTAPDAVRPAPEPPTPAIQTASKTVPITGNKPVTLPERKRTAPETAQFVAKPYIPNGAPTPARIPAAKAAAPIPAAPVAAAVHAGDPRPDDLFQHGRDKNNDSIGNRTASSGKPAAATGSAGRTMRSASARSGAAASGGSVDPRGEGSGGARVGNDGEAGTPSGASSGGVNGGASEAGDVSGGGGANNGGSSAGPADGGESGASGAADSGGSSAGAADGGDTAGDSAGDSGTGDHDAGGGDTGGESGDASEGGSGDGASDAGEAGESDAIGGAVGGAPDAVGDALGGGQGNPDSNDKDQRN